MTRSILLAALLAASLAACSRYSVAPHEPPVDSPVTSLTSGFVPYCGPIWSVDRQGYLIIPCPPGSNFSVDIIR